MEPKPKTPPQSLVDNKSDNLINDIQQCDDIEPEIINNNLSDTELFSGGVLSMPPIKILTNGRAHHITILDLSSSGIDTIPENSLSTMKHIEVIILRDNKIKYPGELFRGNHSFLWKIDLSDNHISELDWLFSNSKKQKHKCLGTLNLSNNFISEFPKCLMADSWDSDNVFLIELSLQNNPITVDLMTGKPHSISFIYNKISSLLVLNNNIRSTKLTCKSGSVASLSKQIAASNVPAMRFVSYITSEPIQFSWQRLKFLTTHITELSCAEMLVLNRFSTTALRCAVNLASGRCSGLLTGSCPPFYLHYWLQKQPNSSLPLIPILRAIIKYPDIPSEVMFIALFNGSRVVGIEDNKTDEDQCWTAASSIVNLPIYGRLLLLRHLEISCEDLRGDSSNGLALNFMKVVSKSTKLDCYEELSPELSSMIPKALLRDYHIAAASDLNKQRSEIEKMKSIENQQTTRTRKTQFANELLRRNERRYSSGGSLFCGVKSQRKTVKRKLTKYEISSHSSMSSIATMNTRSPVCRHPCVSTLLIPEHVVTTRQTHRIKQLISRVQCNNNEIENSHPTAVPNQTNNNNSRVVVDNANEKKDIIDLQSHNKTDENQINVHQESFSGWSRQSSSAVSIQSETIYGTVNNLITRPGIRPHTHKELSVTLHSNKQSGEPVSYCRIPLVGEQFVIKRKQINDINGIITEIRKGIVTLFIQKYVKNKQESHFLEVASALLRWSQNIWVLQQPDNPNKGDVIFEGSHEAQVCDVDSDSNAISVRPVDMSSPIVTISSLNLQWKPDRRGNVWYFYPIHECDNTADRPVGRQSENTNSGVDLSEGTSNYVCDQNPLTSTETSKQESNQEVIDPTSGQPESSNLTVKCYPRSLLRPSTAPSPQTVEQRTQPIRRVVMSASDRHQRMNRTGGRNADSNFPGCDITDVSQQIYTRRGLLPSRTCYSKLLESSSTSNDQLSNLSSSELMKEITETNCENHVKSKWSDVRRYHSFIVKDPESPWHPFTEDGLRNLALTRKQAHLLQILKSSTSTYDSPCVGPMQCSGSLSKARQSYSNTNTSQFLPSTLRTQISEETRTSLNGVLCSRPGSAPVGSLAKLPPRPATGNQSNDPRPASSLPPRPLTAAGKKTVSKSAIGGLSENVGYTPPRPHSASAKVSKYLKIKSFTEQVFAKADAIVSECARERIPAEKPPALFMKSW